MLVYYFNRVIEGNKTIKKLVLVVENSSTQKSLKIIEFLEESKDLVELLYDPPYSPDLNPVERVWKHIRYRVTHNIYFDTLEALKNTIVNYIKKTLETEPRTKLLVLH